jgi:Lysophospholipase L1 and related esterases
VLAGCSLGAAGSASGATAISTPTPASHHVVVVIGDSITGGHGLAPDQAWPVLLARKQGWALTNLGTDGAGFRQQGSSGETYDAQVSDAAELHPDLVIVSGSTNDLGQSADDLMTVTRAEMAKLRAALPHATIVATSTIWSDTDAPPQVDSISDQVRTAAEQVHGIYIDIGQPLFGHPELMQSDDVHPTAAGQRVLADAIDKALTAARVLG